MTTSELQNLFELYVINLDRSADRWQRISQHLDGLGLDAQRVSAVDASQLSSIELSDHYNEHLNKSTFFIGLKPAEIGCFLSHRKVLQRFIDHSDKPYAIILEDDVEFLAPPFTYAKQWQQVLMGTRATMLKLYKRRPINGVLVADAHGTAILRPHLVPLGTQAQVINRKAAKQLLAASEQFGMPVDVAYQHVWQHSVDVLVATPNQINEISEAVGRSSISGTHGLSFPYKAKRELRRSWFRAKLWCKSRYIFWQIGH